MSANKEYLGDSVYADFDGFGVVLTTENGPEGPSNTIYLEPSVLAEVNRYYSRILAKYAAKWSQEAPECPQTAQNAP